VKGPLLFILRRVFMNVKGLISIYESNIESCCRGSLLCILVYVLYIVTSEKNIVS